VARKLVRRPLAVCAAGGTALHHCFELASGVGLVWQPELGLARAASLWSAQVIAWAGLAARAPKRADPVLAALAGASLAGVAVHFWLWPWKLGRAGVPTLTEAEGLSPWQLPAYNAVLCAWAVASAGSLAFELESGSRRYAIAGGALLPLFVVSARHHFEWLREQASVNPAWWNRGVSLLPATAPC
jgi:hypothetical protein